MRSPTQYHTGFVSDSKGFFSLLGIAPASRITSLSIMSDATIPKIAQRLHLPHGPSWFLGGGHAAV